MSVKIGFGCKIDASVRIGTEPFALKKNRIRGFKIRKNAQGGVCIEEFVSIGPFVSIQKGVTRPTIIGQYSFLNEGVRVGHDVQIGKRCEIGLNSTISGYSEIGDDVQIDPGCTISNRIKIGNGARVRIGSLVLDDIPAHGDYAGRPAIPFDEFKRRRIILKELLGIIPKSPP